MAPIRTATIGSIVCTKKSDKASPIAVESIFIIQKRTDKSGTFFACLNVGIDSSIRYGSGYVE